MQLIRELALSLNDSGQQSVSFLTYGTNGNITELDEYDYTGLLMRKTQTDYLATTAYTNLHILDRPTQVRVYDRTAGLISRTDLAYDSTSLSGVTAATNHDDTNFGAAFATRGNVTQVTRYSNATAGSGSVVRQFTYDSLGNQITAQVDCCQSEQRTFTSATQYAFPETITKGPSGTQLVTSRSYDLPTGSILSVTDENQQVTSVGYDSMNRLTSVTRPGNIQTTATYDDASAQPVTTTTRPIDSGKSMKVAVTADGLGRATRQEIRDASNAVFSITETQYDAMGRVSQRSNPHGSSETAVWTQNSYDALGRITKIIPPDGSASSNNAQFLYSGNSVTLTDPAGKQGENFTDPAGRLVQVFEPGYDDGIHATATVTISGEEQSQFQPPTCHLRSCLVYDTGSVAVTANGYRVSVNWGQTSTAISIASALASGFNADANSPVSASAASGVLTLTVKVPGPIGNSYTLGKSSGGAMSPASFTAAITAFFSGGVDGTGSNGHAPSLATPLVTAYYYDALNNLTKVVQGVQQRAFAYDSMSRLTTGTTPEAGAVSYTYTDYSAVATTTDARSVVTAFQYDGLHRLIGTGYTIPNGSNVAAMPNVCTPTGGQPANVCFTYGTSAASNNNGRLIQMTDPTGSESYSYDALGRTTQLQKVLGGVAYTTGYQYNFADELAQINYPSGKQVAQQVDSVGRLNQIQNGSTIYLSNVTYNAAAQPLGATFGNGVQAALTYNSRLQLASLSYTKTGTTLFSLGYDYTFGAVGNNGQIQKITDSVDGTRTTTYTYDAWTRLKTATSTQFSITETYDRYGNRNQQSPPPSFSQAADPNTNRLPFPYAYDAAGNMTSDGLNALVYDGANRVAISTQAGLAGTYSYDGGGLRVKKQVGSASATVYVFSGAKAIAEYAAGGAANSPLREYVYSGTQLLATIEGGATKYHLNDHLSARVTTDSSGIKIGEQGHYPFGESWYSTNTTTKWQFTSYERDSESGNDYAMMRQYVSRLARFSSPDPIGGLLQDPQSLDPYSYTRNDPINSIDPLGLLDCEFYERHGDREDGYYYIGYFCGNDRSFNGKAVGTGGGGGGARPKPKYKNIDECIQDAVAQFYADRKAILDKYTYGYGGPGLGNFVKRNLAQAGLFPARNAVVAGAVGGVTVGVSLLRGLSVTASVVGGLESAGITIGVTYMVNRAFDITNYDQERREYNYGTRIDRDKRIVDCMKMFGVERLKTSIQLPD